MTIRLNKKHGIEEPKEPYRRKWGERFYGEYQDGDIEAIADDMMDYFLADKNRIHISMYAAEKLIPKKTLSNFQNRNEYFKTCYDFVKTLGMARAIELGINAKNPTFAMFFLNNQSSGEFAYKNEIKVTDTMEDKIRNMKPEERRKRIMELMNKQPEIN